MAELLKGAPVARAIGERLAPRIKEIEGCGVTPTLAILRVGERSDDLAYERGAIKRCEGLGIKVRSFVLPADCNQGELLATIGVINADPALHGCLMFRPLPSQLDEGAACRALDPAKDVDGITQGSLYGVFANQQVGFPPCTAAAVIELLDYYDQGIEGANVAVIGRSLVIGKPVSMMLQARNATVTMCHTRTRHLANVCAAADILVVAAGHAGTVRMAHVGPDQTVVDVGINWDEDAEKLVGDVAFDEVEPVVRAVTPVPGGVGSVTTAVLAQHVVEAAERSVA